MGGLRHDVGRHWYLFHNYSDRTQAITPFPAVAVKLASINFRLRRAVVRGHLTYVRAARCRVEDRKRVSKKSSEPSPKTSRLGFPHWGRRA